MTQIKIAYLAVFLGLIAGCASPEPAGSRRDADGPSRPAPSINSIALGKLTEKGGFTVLSDGRYRFDDGALFNAGGTKLNSAGLERVNLLADGLRGSEDAIRIDGHISSDPIHGLTPYRDAYDFAIPFFQAVVLKEALVAEGIPADRVICVSFGSTRPCAPNDSAVNKRMNRRIEIRVQPLVPEARVLHVSDPWEGGCWEAPPTLAGFRIPDDCRFEPGSKDLTAQSRDLLRKFAAWSLTNLADRDDVFVGLDGHAGPGEHLASGDRDKRFGDDRLAFFRAWNARNELIKAGVPQERVVIMSSGAAVPGSDASHPRRVDIRLLVP